jgi:hypothetical protein
LNEQGARRREWLWRAAAWFLPALIPALVGIVPLLVLGPSCGHDFDFHLQSWLAATAAWHGGLVAPQWAAAANFGAGEPRLLFYPPLSWLLGAGLGLMLPWTAVPAAFTGLCLMGAAGAMWRLAREGAGPAAAALAATAYALSPYLLFNAYERTAYAELLAAVWFPLLFKALLPGTLAGTRREAMEVPLRDRVKLAGIALSLAALWFTNAPSGVMGCYLVAAFAVVRVVEGVWRRGRTQSLAGAGRGAVVLLGAVALGCLFAGDYLFPAWYSERFVEIGRAVGPGMRVEDSFLFGHTGEPFHDMVLRTASWIVITTVAVAFAAVLVLLTVQSQEKLRRSRRLAVFLLALVAGCTWMQLRWSLPVWHGLPELGFLQFPWRLLLPVSVAAALLVALAADAVAGSASRSGLKRGAGAMAVAVAMVGLVYAGAMAGWAGQTRYQACDDEDRVPAQLTLLAAGQGFEGTDEYTPRGADNGEIQQGLPPVRLLRTPTADEGDDSVAANPEWHAGSEAAVAGKIDLRGWLSLEHPERFTVRVLTQAPAYAVLRLERFPAWDILVDGRPCGAACMVRDDGLVTVYLPGRAAAETTVISGHYRAGLDAPWDVWVGRGLSLFGLLAMLAIWHRVGRAGG